MTDQTPESQARDYALRRLNVREHSRFELAQSLQRRGFESQVIERVLSELESLNYLSDARCAAAMARHQLKRARGPRYVQAKLRQKGLELDEDRIRALAEEEGLDLLETARSLVERRYPQASQSREEGARAFRFLLSRGFSISLARMAISQSQASD